MGCGQSTVVPHPTEVPKPKQSESGAPSPAAQPKATGAAARDDAAAPAPPPAEHSEHTPPASAGTKEQPFGSRISTAADKPAEAASGAAAAVDPAPAGDTDPAQAPASAAAATPAGGEPAVAADVQVSGAAKPEGWEVWGEADAGAATAAAATAAAVAAGEAAVAAVTRSASARAADAAADAAVLATLPATASKGITLRGLRRLWQRIERLYASKAFAEAAEVVEDGGGKWKLEAADCLEAVTPAHVVHMWAKKASGDGSLADLKSEVDAADVGRPTFYVSHTWGASVKLLIETVEAHLASAGDQARVWVDWVAVRQGSGAGREEDLAGVAQVIGACSGGTLVAADISKVNPATRAWCLYEWGQTLAFHGPDALHFTSLASADLDDMCMELSPATMVSAQARLTADRERLATALTKGFGGEKQVGEELKLQIMLRPTPLFPDLQQLSGRSSAEPWATSLGPVKQWLKQELGTRWTSRALCLLGGEGTGKSCAASAMCQNLLGWLAHPLSGVRNMPPGLWQWKDPSVWPISAAVFLKRGDQASLDPVHIVKSIAYQLSLGLPALREHLMKFKLHDIAGLATPEEAFVLLLSPLASAHEHIIILIDGLDEAEPEPTLAVGVDRSVKASGNPALSLLLSCFVTRLPANVRFILTSRPSAAEGAIRDVLTRTALPNVAFMEPWQLRASDQEAAGAAADGGDAGGGEAKASGEGAAPAPPPNADRVMLFDALVKELGLSLPAPRTPDLDSVYWAYQNAFSPDKGKVSDRTVSLLQVLVAAQEPLPEAMLQEMGLSDALPSLPGWGTLFYAAHGRVRMVHRTLAAWLTGTATTAGASGAANAALAAPRWAAVDPKDGHAALGRYLLRHVLKAGGAVGGSDAADGKEAAAAAAGAEKPGGDVGTPASDSDLMALVPTYAAKYAVVHLARAAAADPTSCAALLDSALAQWEYLRQAFRTGNGANILSALGAMPQRTAYCDDAFRWMRLCFKEFTESPDNMESITLRDCPFSASIKYREAAHRLRAWFTSISFGGAYAGEWPAGLAVLKGHTGAVAAVAYSPDGRQVATGSDDNTARLWDLSTTQCLMVLPGHTGSILSIAFSKDGRLLATGSSDGSAALWDLISGQAIAKMNHGGTVYSVAFSPNSKHLATGSADGTIGIWDLSRTVGFGYANQHTVNLLQNDMGQVFSLAYSIDGKLLLAGCINSIRVWDCEAWAMTAIVAIQMGTGSDKVPSLAFHPDSKHVAAGLLGNARMYDVSTSRLVANVETRGEMVGGDSVAAYAALSLSPDGRRIAVAAENLDSATRVWDWTSGQCVAELAKARIRAVSFSPDGLQLLTGSADNTARIWDLTSRQCLPTAKSNNNIGNVFVVSPDGTKMASILVSKSQGTSIVYVWDLMSWNCVAMLKGHNVVHPGPTGRYLEAAFSPNGRLLTTFSCKDSNVWVWDLVTRKCITMLAGHNRGVSCVSYSPDRKQLICGSRGNTVRVWSLHNGPIQEMTSIGQLIHNMEGITEPVKEEGLASAYPALEGSDGDEVYSVAMSTDKRFVAVGALDRVRILDCAAKRCVASCKAANMSPVTSVVFSPDGNFVAAGSQFEHTVRVFDVATGQSAAELKNHRLSACFALAFSPDNLRVVVGTGANDSLKGDATGTNAEDPVVSAASFEGEPVNTARVWDISSGMWPACVAVLEGHTSAVISVQYSPDGRRIITGSRDQTGRVWEVADGQMMNRTVINPRVFRMAMQRLQA